MYWITTAKSLKNPLQQISGTLYRPVLCLAFWGHTFVLAHICTEKQNTIRTICDITKKQGNTQMILLVEENGFCIWLGFVGDAPQRQ